MPKKSRNLRLSERTWSQLEQLAGWLQVESKTRVVEVLAEKEFGKMSNELSPVQLNWYEFLIGKIKEAGLLPENKARLEAERKAKAEMVARGEVPLKSEFLIID